MRDLSRRLAALEKIGPPDANPLNPKFLSDISDDDLEFVASIRAGDPDWPKPGARHGPVYILHEQTTDAERMRLRDILRRMHHGPDA
jgi:hypothetical protein